MSTAPNIELRPFPVRNALIVDSDPKIDRLLRTIFEPGAWAIQRAPDNATALALAQNKAFELILTSQKTSANEDVELLRRIRRTRPHTRLIILTDQSTPRDVIDAMRGSAFSYFSKPYSMEALAAMIGRAIEEPCWDDGIDIISATPEWIRILARCDRNTADRVLQFFDEVAELPNPERHNVALAFREMLLNAIEHGGKLDPKQFVEVAYVRARHMVTCRISDPGDGFTIDEIPHAAIANPPEDPLRHQQYREKQGLRPGGFGVLLAQQLVDELIYSQDGNEVLLVKYLNTQPS